MTKNSPSGNTTQSIIQFHFSSLQDIIQTLWENKLIMTKEPLDGSDDDD